MGLGVKASARHTHHPQQAPQARRETAPFVSRLRPLSVGSKADFTPIRDRNVRPRHARPAASAALCGGADPLGARLHFGDAGGRRGQKKKEDSTPGLWDQGGLCNHHCDTRESPLYMGGVGQEMSPQ